ncbi:MAG: hypothetical protein HOP27_17380 [Anaerolineales bacterium]|nr:hypothetical protein [Anaerolineales bacterium]
MLQSKKGRALIGLTAILLFIAAAFYTTARAQVVNADEIIKMVNDWKAINLKYGQWIHVVSAITSETSNGVILPDGQPMLSSYIQDDWFYINKDGLVEKGVISMKDNGGNIFQQSAYQNNIMINFTFGDRQENQQPYPLNIDFGFGDRILNAKSTSIVIEKSDGEVKGKSSVIYSYIEKLKLPTQLGAENVIVDAITTKGYFDKETGDFVQIQTIWTLANGREVVFESTEVISIDSSFDAPDEILKVLEAVK